MKSGLLDAVRSMLLPRLSVTTISQSPAAMIEKTRRALEAGLQPQIAVYPDADIDNARRYLMDSARRNRHLRGWFCRGSRMQPIYSSEAMIDALMRGIRFIHHIDRNSTIIACK